MLAVRLAGLLLHGFKQPGFVCEDAVGGRFDDSEAIIHYIDPDSAELADSPADIALHITDRSVAQNLLRMLDSMWKHAQPIENVVALRVIPQWEKEGSSPIPMGSGTQTN